MMKKKVIFWIFFVLIGSSLYATDHSGYIDSDETWMPEDNPHVIIDWVAVNDGIVLTILPGCIVTFDAGTHLDIRGHLVSEGTVTDPIQYTSNSSSPVAGVWDGVQFETSSTGGSLTHCLFEYGGDEYGMILIQCDDVSIFDCDFSESSNYFVEVWFSKTVIIERCSFDGCPTYPVSVSMGTVHNLKNNTFSNNTNNAIEVKSGTLPGTRGYRWVNQGVPYAITAWVNIDPGAVLNLDPGCIIKFGGDEFIHVHGTINSVGTQSMPIVFTSLKDDTYGGDTNGDVDMSIPQPGDWRYINFWADAATPGSFKNTIFRYGGAFSGGVDEGMLVFHKYPAEIVGCTFEYAQEAAIRYDWTQFPGEILYCNFNENYMAVDYNSGIDPGNWINAPYNWWGHDTGPYDPSSADGYSNPDGLGDRVTDYVKYWPMLIQPYDPNPGGTLGVTLIMPQTMYTAGDTFYLDAVVNNPTQTEYDPVYLFVILDVYATYFFAPGFSMNLDYYTTSAYSGAYQISILPRFTWPSNAGNADNIRFYGAMTDPEISHIIGDYDVATFGWQ
ncbi:right-handed parallel beta-helix repeat-containing protein [bacterium]|nr:right-handed parallel beta-helix repeat-containing protein [candidate division CSSED10-310 bacterium]